MKIGRIKLILFRCLLNDIITRTEEYNDNGILIYPLHSAYLCIHSVHLTQNVPTHDQLITPSFVSLALIHSSHYTKAYQSQCNFRDLLWPMSCTAEKMIFFTSNVYPLTFMYRNMRNIGCTKLNPCYALGRSFSNSKICSSSQQLRHIHQQ